MTVTYSLEVSRARLCGFAKLLLRWQGSIYKLMYREIFIFAICYYAVALLYRVALQNKEQKRVFESIAVYCKDFTDSVPMTFVMGFFVAMVVHRWWQMYMTIPWVDVCALQIAAFIQGMDERGRLIRRSLVRYLNLMWVLTFQATSTVIKKRFPTRDHLVEGGLMTVEEKMSLEEIASVHGDWFIPGSWFTNLAMEARKEGRIHDDLHLKSIVDTMLEFRGGCGMAYSYDWISIPLVYTQVVTIVVYSFFTACLMGRQYLLSEEEGGGSSTNNSSVVDKYIPLFTLFQFFFYFGWLKVAEVMICPFGEDDDDFELNWVLDRNVQVGLMYVDEFYRKHPKLTHDQFWNELDPEIPYTEAASAYKRNPYLGSTVSMNINAKQMEWQVPEPIAEEDGPFLDRKKSESGTLNDEESGGERRTLDVPSPSFRPKFLNRLLPGNSRLSLAGLSPSRFGSKISIRSGRNGGTTISGKSPYHSPRSSSRRHRNVPVGQLHSFKNRRPSFNRYHHHRASETSHNSEQQQRPVSVYGIHQQFSDSRLSSMITLDDGDHIFRTHSSDRGLGNLLVGTPITFLASEQNSPAGDGKQSTKMSPLAQEPQKKKDAAFEIVSGVNDGLDVNGFDSPLNLEEHEITWPKDTVACQSVTGSGSGSGENGGYLESVNVPPALAEVPEEQLQETETAQIDGSDANNTLTDSDATIISLFTVSRVAEDNFEQNEAISTRGGITEDEKFAEEKEFSGSSEDEEQKTVSSITLLVPKEEEKN